MGRYLSILRATDRLADLFRPYDKNDQTPTFDPAGLSIGDEYRAVESGPATRLAIPEKLSVDALWEWWIERAAILEFDGGMNREDAERRAFELWFQRFVSREI